MLKPLGTSINYKNLEQNLSPHILTSKPPALILFTSNIDGTKMILSGRYAGAKLSKELVSCATTAHVLLSAASTSLFSFSWAERRFLWLATLQSARNNLCMCEQCNTTFKIEKLFSFVFSFSFLTYQMCCYCYGLQFGTRQLMTCNFIAYKFKSIKFY